jgi:hypothetical protein
VAQVSFATQLRENLAAESDPRTTAVDFRWWGAIRGTEALWDREPDDERSDGEAWVRIKFEVCPACDGRGQYVNPSIDAHGLTADDFDEAGPDFADEYRRGDYDVQCVLCGGEKVVPVPLDEDILRQINEEADDRYQYRAEQLAEMRMGA